MAVRLRHVFFIGNAGGLQVPASVIPFLLRGINLLGIDSVSHQPYDNRVQAWARLATDFPLDKLDSIANGISCIWELDDLAQASQDIVDDNICPIFCMA